MALQKLTIELPEKIYQRIASLAKKFDRPFADETIKLIQAALNQESSSTLDVEDRLEQLAFLTERELLKAVKATAAAEDVESMQGLLEKQQREGLTASELEQVQSLSSHFNQIMLVRAKSAALLVERGHDISKLMLQP